MVDEFGVTARNNDQLAAMEELAGSMATFDRLDEAANTMGRYYVHDA